MRFVADTHCLVWHFGNNPRLSPVSKEMFSGTNPDVSIVVPTIVLAELLYLSRKLPLPTPFDRTLTLLENGNQFDIQPISLPIVREACSVPDFEIHDTLIVATARHLAVPLMTADQKIISSGTVQTLRP